MSTPFTVHWAGIAEEDLTDIILYIAADNPISAGNIFGEIQEAASSLTLFPERGRVVPELRDQSIFLYRGLIAAPWRIVYRVSDQRVYVLAVIDSRRNVEDVLLKRLIK